MDNRARGKCLSQLLGKRGKHSSLIRQCLGEAKGRHCGGFVSTGEEGGAVLLLSSGEERAGKEGEGGVIAEGLKYGQSWTKEVKLGGDS